MLTGRILKAPRSSLIIETELNLSKLVVISPTHESTRHRILSQKRRVGQPRHGHKQAQAESVYKLSAMVLHTGTSFLSGHYTTALCCDSSAAPFDGNEKTRETPRNDTLDDARNLMGKWVLVDDERASEIPENELQRMLGTVALVDGPLNTPSTTVSIEKSSSPYLLFYRKHSS